MCLGHSDLTGMPGGVFEIIGVLALLVAGCELWVRVFPRHLVDEMQEIVGDQPWPRLEPEVEQLRKRGAL